MTMQDPSNHWIFRRREQTIEGPTDVYQQPGNINLRLQRALENHGRGIHEFAPFGATEYLGVDNR